MEIKSILIEYENIAESKTYASSGILINNKFVIITANILANLLKTSNELNAKIFNNKHAFIKPEDILINVPKLNVILNIDDNKIEFRNGNITRAFISNNIRDTSIRTLKDWAIDVEEGLRVKELLCLFFIITLNDAGENYLDELKSNLRKYCDEFDDDFYVGKEIFVDSAPFGNRHFFNTCSRGIISNIVDNKECLILTDCPTAVGSEGGLVLSNKKPIGTVLSSISWYKNEWLGLTLITNLRALFAEMLDYNCDIAEHQTQGRFYENVAKNAVRIVCGLMWGSGILLSKEKGLFITNAHVVETFDDCTVFWRNVRFSSKVIFRTGATDSYDIAILKVDPNLLENTDMEAAILSSDLLRNGDVIYAIGYPLFTEDVNKCPTLTKGHVSKVSASMLKTTSSVLGGSSGGGLYDSNGKLVGIIVANVRLEDNNVIYPRFNVAVPIRAIWQIINDYFTNEDVRILEKLRTISSVGEKEWNLLASKL